MNASSYLEGFLTVYGWMMYATLYELFSMLWLIFLPFLMLFYNFLRDVVTDNGYSGYGHFKSTIVNFIMMVLILFTCVVPLDAITIEESKLSTICNSAEKLSEHYKPPSGSTFQFDITDEGKIPLLPSLVMRISQGTNNVIFRNMTCAPKVANLALAFDSSQIRSEEVRDEMNNFVDQCYRPAKTRMNSLHGKVSSDITKKLAEYFAKQNVSQRGKTWPSAGYSSWNTTNIRANEEIRFQEEFMGSEFMLFMMDPSKYPAAINSITLSAEAKKNWTNLVGNPPKSITSQSDIANVTATHPNRSAYQKNNNAGPVACADWWVELKPKLQTDAMDDLRKNFIGKNEAHKCSHLSYSSCPTENEVKAYYKMQDTAIFNHKMNLIILNSQRTATGAMALSQNERDLTTAGMLMSVVGFIPGVPAGVSSLVDSATTFYAEMFMYKIIAKFLQPMLLMGIFAFWGIYLIVSSYRGETVFRGLVLIFAITLLPSIWAVADYLDSYLYQAMYPFDDVVTAKRGSTIERMILDAANTAFYVIFPFILLYMISEAGGPRGDKATQGSDGQARNIGGRTGGTLGGTAGGLAGNYAGHAKGQITSKFNQVFPKSKND